MTRSATARKDDDMTTTTEQPAGLLSAEDLTISFASDEGYAEVIRGVTFSIRPGESVGIVGESGSGKSVTCKALLGRIEAGGRLTRGDVAWEGKSLLGKGGRAHLGAVRGKKLTTIPQDPMMALDPVFTVGYQIEEVCRHVRGMNRSESRRRAAELLELVGVPSPERRLNQYPHEFSGGMQQRVLIAMALDSEPELLIADEPTPALDVTVQSQILQLLRDLKDELNLALLLVTHDLGVVAEVCDRVLVMYAGKIVEEGSCDHIFNEPAHPYTRGLLASTPRMDDERQQQLEGIPGVPPSPFRRPPGCNFAPRCSLASAECQEEPELLPVRSGLAACWKTGESA